MTIDTGRDITPAATYTPLRTAASTVAELLERYADVDFQDVAMYDNDGPTVVLTPADETPATAERIRADLNLSDSNEYGQFQGFYGGTVDSFGVWVSVDTPFEPISRARRLWFASRPHVLGAGLVGAGAAIGYLAAKAVTR